MVHFIFHSFFFEGTKILKDGSDRMHGVESLCKNQILDPFSRLWNGLPNNPSNSRDALASPREATAAIRHAWHVNPSLRGWIPRTEFGRYFPFRVSSYGEEGGIRQRKCKTLWNRYHFEYWLEKPWMGQTVNFIPHSRLYGPVSRPRGSQLWLSIQF